MALQKLGYVSQGIEYMVSEITKVLAKYESPEEATRVLENALPRVVHSRFGEKQFRAFIREIDPAILRGFDPDFDPLDDWERKEMTKQEITDFEKERREIVRNLTIQQKRDYQHIAIELEFGDISQHHHVASKNYRIGEPVHRSVQSQYSVPIGGQPGYHRKMRRR
jgi:hypothetical protein